MFQTRLKNRIFPMCFGVAAVLVCAHAQTPRLRVAIYPFDQSLVQNNIQKEVGGNVNYGQIASELLVSQLASQVDVINRDQIQHLLEEQKRKYDERFDPSQAPEYGKLLGVDAIVTGSLTSLSADQHASKGVGGLFNAAGGVFGKKAPNVNTDNTTIDVKVQLTAEMISTVSGKTLASYKADGAANKQLSGKLQINNHGSDDSSASKSGLDPYVREALQQAISKVGSDFAAAYATAPRLSKTENLAGTTKPKSENEYTALPDEVGNVFKVDGGKIIFLTAPGVKIMKGDVLEVKHPESGKNPRTGATVVIGQTLGTLKVTEVSTDNATGEYQGKTATDQDRIVKTQAAH